MNGIQDIETPVRKCGLRSEHGVYAVGGSQRSADGVLSPFTLINPPVPYQVKVHRGPRVVDASAILSRLPMDEWWVGGSQKTEEKKAGDAWAIETFGMTLHKRLEIGECAGAAGPDDALAILAAKIRLDTQVIKYFREITRAKINEIPRVTVHYEALHEALATFVTSKGIGDLMAAQAAVWRMAYNLPPSKRREYVPHLQRILVLMNLKKDAGAMTRVFGG